MDGSNRPLFYLLPSVVVSVHVQHLKNDYVQFVQQRCDRNILAVILGQPRQNSMDFLSTIFSGLVQYGGYDSSKNPCRLRSAASFSPSCFPSALNNVKL